MSFVGMKKYVFPPIFDTDKSPECKNCSLRNSIIHATYVVYHKAILIGIKNFEL